MSERTHKLNTVTSSYTVQLVATWDKIAPRNQRQRPTLQDGKVQKLEFCNGDYEASSLTVMLLMCVLLSFAKTNLSLYFYETKCAIK